MKKEKVVLSFIGVIIGLIFAGIVFYFYQSTKTINTAGETKTKSFSPSPTPTSSLYLIINEPEDEKVSENKIIKLSGQTVTDATIVIITKSGQEVIKPTSMGTFTTTLTLEEGENLIKIIAFAGNGESTTIERTITYSTEDF
jgi:hypothetical protein